MSSHLLQVLLIVALFTVAYATVIPSSSLRSMAITTGWVSSEESSSSESVSVSDESSGSREVIIGTSEEAKEATLLPGSVTKMKITHKAMGIVLPQKVLTELLEKSATSEETSEESSSESSPESSSEEEKTKEKAKEEEEEEKKVHHPTTLPMRRRKTTTVKPRVTTPQVVEVVKEKESIRKLASAEALEKEAEGRKMETVTPHALHLATVTPTVVHYRATTKLPEGKTEEEMFLEAREKAADSTPSAVHRK